MKFKKIGISILICLCLWAYLHSTKYLTEEGYLKHINQSNVRLWDPLLIGDNTTVYHLVEFGDHGLYGRSQNHYYLLRGNNSEKYYFFRSERKCHAYFSDGKLHYEGGAEEFQKNRYRMLTSCEHENHDSINIDELLNKINSC